MDTQTVWGVLAVLAALAVCVALLLIRVRVLAGRIGAFECALRPPRGRAWMSGIAVFGDDAVQWYRLVSLSWRPKYILVRDEMTLGEIHHRGRSGHVVDVSCTVAMGVFELGMVEESHSALVAWLESAAPTQPSLF